MSELTHVAEAAPTVHDAAKSQAAAMAKAQVQTRYELALMRPRNIDKFRTDILGQMKVPVFAQAARYNLPIGKGVQGWSIRFAEEALRLMGNIDVQTSTIYDDDLKRIVRVAVVDLERNTSYSAEEVIEKTTERRNLKAGQQAVAIRTGSEGQQVFVVQATERDMMMKTNAAASRIIRTQGLRHVPEWILDECLSTGKDAFESGVDPNRERKAIVDAFTALGVGADQLAAYLGHELSGASEAELFDLRAIYQTIKEGAAKWRDYEAMSGTSAAGEDDPHAKTRATLAAKREALEAKSGKRSAKKGKA